MHRTEINSVTIVKGMSKSRTVAKEKMSAEKTEKKYVLLLISVALSTVSELKTGKAW